MDTDSFVAARDIWCFMKRSKKCSDCQKSNCETLYKNEANEEYFVRKCDIAGWKMLPASLKKELGINK